MNSAAPISQARAAPWQALALFGLAVFCLRLPAFFRSVLDWDESLYALMAGLWLRGHLPYTAIWDNKPVVIYAIFAVFEAVFRAPVLAIRIATAAAAAVSAFVVWRLAPLVLPAPPERDRGFQAVVLPLFAAAAFIIASLSNDGLSANTELFMESFSAAAILAAAAPGFCQNAPCRRGLIAGLLFGLACMTKYVAVFEAPAVAFALLTSTSISGRFARPRTIAGAAAGAALVPGAVMLIYAAAGELSLWWQCSIADNLIRVAAPVSAARLHDVLFAIAPRWLPLFAAGVVLLAAAPAIIVACLRARALSPAARGHALLGLWLAGGALGVAAAKSFYDHYFLQLLPALCLSAAWVLARLAPRLVLTPARLAVAAVAILIIPAIAGFSALAAATAPLLTSGRFGPDIEARMANDLRPEIAIGASLYVFDGQPILYALTGAAPPTRYVLPSVLTRCFLARVAGVDAPREVARILAQNPTFIVVNPYPPSGPAAVDQTVYGEVSAALAGRYTTWRTYPDAVVYRLRPGAPPLPAMAAPPSACH